ncbi:hypothetical protein [Halorientalis litorea]|uniref:hypothetical protein n=1 Tax=Halorientalis litorea TaxID=2931977 RepID=UPI001FF642D3|nr:hypothetical protein [Halorientalis litorea]
MTECDDCGSDVAHVWRHREFESETKRTLHWVCPACHPDLPSELTVEVDASTAPEDGQTGAPELRSDGGVVSTTNPASPSPSIDTDGRFDCPICSGATVNGQGMYDCLDCGWTGPR